MKHAINWVLIFTAAFLATVSSDAKDVTMKWKSIKGAVKYDLQVSKDADFSDIFYSKTVKEPSFVKDLGSGKYFLRVRGIDDDGLAGNWSPAFKMVVTAPVVASEKVMAPKTVTYVGKAPQVGATWKVDDKATSFKVSLVKDGKQVQSKETSKPHVDFHPSEPGDYKVVVNSGYDGYFGPPVTVEELHVEQKPLVAPKPEMPPWKKYNSRHSIDVKWMPSPDGEAKSYVVKIYKADDFSQNKKGDRAPASAPVATFTNVTSDDVKVPPLPPGRYVAAVQSVSNDDTLSSTTTIPLDVARGKPVEVEKYDLQFNYGVTGMSFKTNLQEAQSFVQTNSTGSSVAANGNLWLYDSNFGLKVGGSWNSFITQGVAVTYSDLLMAAQYRVTSEEGLRKEFKPFLGARAWNLPIVFVPNQNGNLILSQLQEMNTTAVGPVAGFEYVRPVSEHVALVAGLQFSVPVVATPVVGGGPSQSLQSNGPSAKVGIGAKVALPGGMRLIAMAGMQHDEIDFSPFQTNNNNNNNSSGGTDQVSVDYPSISIGIETASDGSSFRANSLSAPPSQIFSNIDFTTSYAVEPTNYAAGFSEGGNNVTNASGTFGALVNFEANGFFKDSHSGLRLNAGWDVFSYQNTSIVNPTFEAQWGYRPMTENHKEGWNWANYFGLRLWRIPVVQIQSNFFDAESSQLLGPVDTFILTKDLGSSWTGRFLAELSTPIFLTDKSYTVGSVQANQPSAKAEVAGIRAVSPDLSFGLGAGYKMDQLQYTTTAGGGNSSIQMAAPIFDFFGKYSF